MWSVARDHARAKALLDEPDGPMCGMLGGPILLEPLDGMSVHAPSLHYRYEPPENTAVSFPSYRLGAPLSVLRPKGDDYARSANSAPCGALQAVQSKCRGLSLIMPGAVVAQNRLFWVLTLSSISKLPSSKGYGPGRAVKFSNLHFFLCAIHTHDHD